MKKIYEFLEIMFLTTDIIFCWLLAGFLGGFLHDYFNIQPSEIDIEVSNPFEMLK